MVEDRQDLRTLGELVDEQLKISPRKHRSAEITDALRVNPVEAANIRIVGGLQIILQALANHGALLARNRFQVLVVVGADRPPEVRVHIRSTKPAGGPRRAVEAEFQTLRTQTIHLVRCALAQQFDALAIGAQRSTAHTEGVGDQRAAKYAAIQVNERQYTGDLIAAPGVNIMRAVAERLLDNRAPSGPVKEGPVRMGFHKIIPASAGRFRQRLDDGCGGMDERGVSGGGSGGQRPDYCRRKRHGQCDSSRNRRVSASSASPFAKGWCNGAPEYAMKSLIVEVVPDRSPKGGSRIRRAVHRLR